MKHSKFVHERKYSDIKQTGCFEAIVVRLVTLIIAHMKDIDCDQNIVQMDR